MSKTREKFRELLNDIAEHDGVRRFNKLAELTGIAPNTFTRIKKNEGAEVDVETFRKLNAAFGNRYNIQWFQGDSDYMLLADVPEKEKGNPDFSSYINALLAKSDETIASLKRELAAKDDIIQAKDDRIADLTKLADERLHRISELRRVIDAHNINMADYPFPVGVADENDYPNNEIVINKCFTTHE
jgi:transcriptional regulator with XRE-family HTH domain